MRHFLCFDCADTAEAANIKTADKKLIFIISSGRNQTASLCHSLQTNNSFSPDKNVKKCFFLANTEVLHNFFKDNTIMVFLSSNLYFCRSRKAGTGHG